MITVRNYTETDVQDVGCLITDTYAEFNLAFTSSDNQSLMLGLFRHAHSSDEAHQSAIAGIPPSCSNPRDHLPDPTARERGLLTHSLHVFLGSR